MMSSNKLDHKKAFKLQAELNILNEQRKQLTAQIEVTEKALEELPKITEEKVFKVINGVLIQKETKQVIDELKNKHKRMTEKLASVESDFSKGMKKMKNMGIEFMKSAAAEDSTFNPGDYILPNFNLFNNK